jgi:uncharacterized alkaline shock family protein YloU
MPEHKRASPLEQSKVSIAEEVIASIAGIAASEVAGLGTLKGSVADGLASIFGESRQGKGVEASQRAGASALYVRLKISVKYGYPIHDVAKSVQARVKQEIEAMTGLKVSTIDVFVQEIQFADPAEEALGT